MFDVTSCKLGISEALEYIPEYHTSIRTFYQSLVGLGVPTKEATEACGSLAFYLACKKYGPNCG